MRVTLVSDGPFLRARVLQFPLLKGAATGGKHPTHLIAKVTINCVGLIANLHVPFATSMKQQIKVFCSPVMNLDYRKGTTETVSCNVKLFKNML